MEGARNTAAGGARSRPVRAWLSRTSWRTRVVALVAAVAVLLLGAVVADRAGLRGPQADPLVGAEEVRVAGVPEADGRPVELDATLYVPQERAGPAPAVLLAHGFGGSKDSVADEARRLAAEGYVVLAWTARGFGASGGLIHLDAPAYEVADARRLLDLLAAREEVRTDAAGDPRVAVVGASYGGALALLLAGLDARVDAIVPMITWNDLRRAFFPQHAVAAGPPATPAQVDPVGGGDAPQVGVFKRLWAGAFFSSGASPTAPGAGGGAARPTCGRFAPDLCAAYDRVAATGRPDAQLLRLLAASSPSSVLDRVRAPALLVQGEGDSLFPLDQSDATAEALARTGAPVKVVWAQGGHDGGFDAGADALRAEVDAWLATWVAGDSPPADRARDADLRFEAAVPRAVRTRGDRDRSPPVLVAPGLPGGGWAAPVPTTTLPLSGAAQTVVSPAGGTPAAITLVPGLGALTATLAAVAGTPLDNAAITAPPGQTATFETPPLADRVQVVGSPRVRLAVRSSTGDATLFAATYDVGPDGSAALPQRLVAPVRQTGLPAGGREVEVALPAIVRDVPAGHRLRVVVSTTDAAYALPADARTYAVGLAPGASLLVPTAVPAAEGGGLLQEATGPSVARIALGVAASVLAVAGLGLLRARRARRRGAADLDPDLAGVPLAVRGLGKAYGDGFRAVSDLAFTVGRGQVLGLLGPNGAGKTTTLRMLLGLIVPSEGELRVFGHRIRPGAPVLSRVGALVEGPGLLPHLSGLANLQAYWRATGRPEADARFDVALEIAGLEDDVHRRVGTYSQGMRQRLAVAQAMLGLPELLVLDEPTNGLDPPQIREMREVLRSYAATGRTVVVSSHLLAEVEQSCSHVVVMSHGRLVAQGEVSELVGTATSLVVDVDAPGRAAEVIAQLPGARDVRVTPTGLVLRLVGTPRSELVRALVGAGLSVERVTPQHGLEEAFLTLVGEREGRGA